MLRIFDRDGRRFYGSDQMTDYDSRREYFRPNNIGLAALGVCIIAGLVILLGAVLATALVGLYSAAAMVVSLCLAVAMLMPPGSTDIAA